MAALSREAVGFEPESPSAMRNFQLRQVSGNLAQHGAPYIHNLILVKATTMTGYRVDGIFELATH